MRLHIASSSEKLDLQIAWVELNTPVGNFVIQSEHAPMVVTLDPISYVTYRLTSGKEKIKKVVHGIAHVTREEVTLLITQ